MDDETAEVDGLLADCDDVRPAVVVKYLDSAAEIGAALRASTTRPRCSM